MGDDYYRAVRRETGQFQHGGAPEAEIPDEQSQTGQAGLGADCSIPVSSGSDRGLLTYTNPSSDRGSAFPILCGSGPRGTSGRDPNPAPSRGRRPT
jgi:hypothetical protein